MADDAVNAPLTVAVIGSGPAGFYTAGALLEQSAVPVRVDLYERLATPWGLVRAGVAPDHPKIKAVSSVYAATAADTRFRFFGNVEVGRHVSREELVERYDAVVYTVGAQGERRLGIPGEDLPGSVSAVDVVGWYNGHPDFADRAPDLSGRRAVVIGAGNVALDVARILCSPVERLAATDIADHALDALRASAIEQVVVVGRRGPAQAAFTTAELRELPEFTGAPVDVDPAEVAEQPGEEKLSRLIRRNLAVLRDYAAALPSQPSPTSQPAPAGTRRMALRFLRSPVEIRGEGRVAEVVFARNRLEVDAEGWVSAVDTGEREVFPADLVVRAVGYKGLPLAGLPFDERRGIIPNDAGRVAGADREYVAGWIKRGPTGIIGTNRKCAVETVATLLADVAEGRLARHPRAGGVDPVGEGESWLRERQPDLVTEAGWRLIDAAERASGEPAGRPRVKLTTLDALVDTALTRTLTV
ncbi:NADPH-dependent glutamate synthase beta chain-like oxidoreductase [Frankia torreyi]|uniref:ferredoxin--NADP(+) reductase n=1 Tax=Frankia torreyi TaxID=1856 RepID=A0A0D8BCC2_9ACTN|nr:MULTISPECIES: FAD-dependent oxidoreductase [Frankia]KJE21821.1 NADPH-dependent glutamate synthase beta chain-like oxidoreductase [Frankia torreyi]KQC38197.1 NADP oxidoreductase [Frankia sp. ACN1ag]